MNKGGTAALWHFVGALHARWSRNGDLGVKSELAPLLVARIEKRGWQALYDVLNQAKGYIYLRRLGYPDVRFIPRAKARGQRTPDLAAYSDSIKALCEVKTKRIAYVVVNFDDSLHEYADLYRTQIEQYIEHKNPAPKVDIVFDIESPFYAAMA